MAKRLNLNTGLMDIAAHGRGMRATSEDEILSIADTILSIREEISELYEQIAANTLFSINEETGKPEAIGFKDEEGVASRQDRIGVLSGLLSELEGIDVSHNATLHRQEFINLFKQNQVKVIRSLAVEIELNFREYLSHAFQSKSSLEKIRDLLEEGLRDRDISRFLYMNEDKKPVFKRSVFLILGQKREE